MQDLQKWFTSPNYDEGAQLYLKYGNDPTLKALFTKEAETEFKRKRMMEALTELLHTWKNPTSRKAIIQRQIEKTPAIAHRGWPNPIHDLVIQKLYDRWKPLYTEMLNLQARSYEVSLLAQAGDPDLALNACQVAHKILDLDDQVEEIYAERDYYLLNGKLPARIAEPEVVGDPIRWATELQNNNRYVRRYKAKLNEFPTHRLAAGWAQLLQEKQKLVTHYRKLLKLEDE